jgi:hypothetical protein
MPTDPSRLIGLARSAARALARMIDDAREPTDRAALIWRRRSDLRSNSRRRIQIAVPADAGMRRIAFIGDESLTNLWQRRRRRGKR